MDDNAETIAEIVAELAQYEESGERPCKEEVWRLGARVAAAARVEVIAEQEACIAAIENVPVYLDPNGVRGLAVAAICARRSGEG